MNTLLPLGLAATLALLGTQAKAAEPARPGCENLQ